MFRNAFSLIGITLIGVVTSRTALAQMPSGRSELFSQWAVDRYCSMAQQLMTGTPYFSYNLVHSSFDSFTQASAAPYDSATNLSAYNGKATSGTALPLTTQQLVSHRVLTGTTWEYPIVISCKMKDAEAIIYHFGSGAAGTQQTCREVNQATVADVYANLTSVEQRMLRYPQSQIAYPPDVMHSAGPSWLGGLPYYLPQVAYILTSGPNAGKLAIRGIAINVARTNTDPSAGPDKKGSYYCHFPSPEYIRALITGQTEPIIENPPE
jgi:hypothetical protein